MPTARTNDDTALSYKTNGSGRCHLLFMHDWGGSCSDFNDVLNYLDFSNLRAITYDYRGHGSSDKSELGYTLQRFSQDAFDVLDHAGATKTILIGFGMGAKLAQYAAAIQRERVSGLILIAGAPASPIEFPASTQAKWLNSAGNREKLIALKRSMTSHFVGGEVIERWADKAAKVSHNILESTIKMTTETSFTDRLAAINCPIFIIGGLHDPIFTPDVLCNAVAKPLGNARLAVLDSNHEIPIEQPRELAGLILAFLAGMKTVPFAHRVNDEHANGETRQVSQDTSALL